MIQLDLSYDGPSFANGFNQPEPNPQLLWITGRVPVRLACLRLFQSGFEIWIQNRLRREKSLNQSAANPSQ